MPPEIKEKDMEQNNILKMTVHNNNLHWYVIYRNSDFNKEYTLLIRFDLNIISNILWGLEQRLWACTSTESNFSQVLCGLKLMKWEKEPMEYE